MNWGSAGTGLKCAPPAPDPVCEEGPSCSGVGGPLVTAWELSVGMPPLPPEFSDIRPLSLTALYQLASGGTAADAAADTTDPRLREATPPLKADDTSASVTAGGIGYLLGLLTGGESSRVRLTALGLLAATPWP